MGAHLWSVTLDLRQLTAALHRLSSSSKTQQEVETNQGLWRIPGKRVAANLAYGKAPVPMGGWGVGGQSMLGMQKLASEVVLTLADAFEALPAAFVGPSVHLWRSNVSICTTAGVSICGGGHMSS